MYSREIFNYFDTKGDEKVSVGQVIQCNFRDVLNLMFFQGWRCSPFVGLDADWNWNSQTRWRVSTRLVIFESVFDHDFKIKCNFSESRLTFEAFLPIYQSMHKLSAEPNVDALIDGLASFDREGNGQIMVAELRHVLTNVGKLLCFSTLYL